MIIIKPGLAYAQVLSYIGVETFVEAHKDSAPASEVNRYVREKYNVDCISREISDPGNVYHIIKHDDMVAGFSKMMFNSMHPDLPVSNVSKLDQLYLLDAFHGLKLGAKLLQFNIDLSKANEQNGMWLIVWVGNGKAILFYEKFGFKTIGEGDFQLTDIHVSRYYLMFLSYNLKN